jgi:predicted CopG family antitoxin
MARTTIKVTQPAYDRLKKQKLPGETFSDVVLREIPGPRETAGEILDYFKLHPIPKANRKVRETILANRGRSEPGTRKRKAKSSSATRARQDARRT